MQFNNVEEEPDNSYLNTFFCCFFNQKISLEKIHFTGPLYTQATPSIPSGTILELQFTLYI